MTADDPRCALLLSLLQRGPRTWRDLTDAGLTRADVLAAVDALSAAELVIVQVGPLLVERMDLPPDTEGPTP